MLPVMQLSRGAVWCALAAGVLVGVAYTVSPTAVVFLCAIAILLRWAQLGTSPRERRWVLGILLVSLAIRLAILVGVFAAGGSREGIPVMIGDEWLIKWRSLLLLNMAQGRILAPADYIHVSEEYGRTSVMNLFAIWQGWFGPAPFGTHLINLWLWFAASIMLFRTSRRAFGPLPALGGLIVLLFMPTLVIWSVSALKEPAFFFFTALAIVGATALCGSDRIIGRVAGAIVIAVAVIGIGPVRSSALVVTAGGVGLGVAGWVATRRGWMWVAALCVLMAVGWKLQANPVVQAQVMKNFRLAANNHLGHVQTLGYSYKLLDQRFYMNWDVDPIKTLQPEEAARFTGRALVSFVTEPIPWQAQGAAVAFIAQQMVWYLLAALAVAGAISGWRRDAVFTWMLIGNVIVGGAVVALFNGNVGTFVRFRDSVVTIIVWLSALGGCAVIEWAARRFSGDNSDGFA